MTTVLLRPGDAAYGNRAGLARYRDRVGLTRSIAGAQPTR